MRTALKTVYLEKFKLGIQRYAHPDAMHEAFIEEMAHAMVQERVEARMR